MDTSEDEYLAVISMICTTMLQDMLSLMHAGEEKEETQMLITGMSGTGKSAWLLYLMWRLAKASKTMAYQITSEKICVVNRQGHAVIPDNELLF